MQRPQKYEKLSLITVFVITHQGILNQTSADNLVAVDVFVAYRDQFPDENTVDLVKKKLKQNDIEYSQLADFSMDNCKWAESSTEEGRPAQRRWRRKWKANFCGFKLSGELNIFLDCNLMYKIGN